MARRNSANSPPSLLAPQSQLQTRGQRTSFNRPPPLFPEREREEPYCTNICGTISSHNARIYAIFIFFVICAILNRAFLSNILSTKKPVRSASDAIHDISDTSARDKLDGHRRLEAIDSKDEGDVPKLDSHWKQQDARPANGPSASTASGETREANLAFFIQLAENTVPLLPRLLATLYHPKNVYAIHFDRKIPEKIIAKSVASIRANAMYKHNVYIMDSELITYRGISMLLNTINAMRVLTELPVSWDYFINLSGSDYPLQSAGSLRQILGGSTDLNYFTFAAMRTWDAMAENRLGELWFDESLAFHENATINKLTKLRVRNPLIDTRHFTVSHAEAWMISSRAFCHFVLRSDMARKMLVAFAYAVDSSEHFFASLAWNDAKLKKTIVPHSLRFIIWKHNGVLSGQHPYKVDAQNEDGSFKFKENVNETVLLFARKFEQQDSKLMDFIDRRAQRQDVIDRAKEHVTKKVASRHMRLSEL